MCSHTLRIDIAMQTLQRIGYPLFSSVQFGGDKKSFLGSLGVNIFSAAKICQLLHLVKEVSDAYNMATLFLFGLWGGCQTALQSFKHAFTSFGTITQKRQPWTAFAQFEHAHYERDQLIVPRCVRRIFCTQKRRVPRPYP